MKRAIIYIRMSTYAPHFNGHIMKRQLKRCKEYCKLNEIKVAHVMEEYNEAKTFNRPEWNKVMEMIEFNPNRVSMIVFERWGCLSYDIEQLKKLRSKLKTIGVELISVKSIDLDSVRTKFYL